MFNRYDLVHIPGKRGRKVPLILAPEWTEAMELLTKSRGACHVTSQYFFGKAHSSAYIQPWKVPSDFRHVLGTFILVLSVTFHELQFLALSSLSFILLLASPADIGNEPDLPAHGNRQHLHASES
jgi:hypothetical protein